jgi:mediator of RNA polymerase II transcription subunit 20
LDNGQKQIPLITDLIFDLLMLKVSPFYSTKKMIKIESKGPRFELGDFLVKLGSVTMSQNQNFKGILIECDYRPCLVPRVCWELIKEFLQGFLGNQAPTTIPTYFSNPIPNSHFLRQDEIYQPIDTIQQYLEHFNNYRKQSQI